MSDLRSILEDLRASSDEIVERWAHRLGDEPWLRLPEEAKIDHVPEMVDALVAALLGEPSEEEAREHLMRVALRHGRDRREQDLEDAVLHREHHLLRGSIWDTIREHHGRGGAALQAIALIDMLTTMTTTGSLHGFHRADVADRRETAERLAGEGPWPEPV